MSKKKVKTSKSKAWFIRVRGSYLPNSRAGWLTYIPYVAYTGGAMVYVLSRHYDLLLSALLLVPNWVAAAVVMNAIAEKKS